MSQMRVQAWALEGIPEVAPGDDLLALILRAISAADPDDQPIDGDILVVTSKILSKAEGRIVAAENREDAIAAETVRVVATRGATRIVENRLGIVQASAGVDASNVAEGTVLLLPVDPDASARALCAGLRKRLGVTVGVIVSDTLGRAWRVGHSDVAIGAGGILVVNDLRGTVDAHGRVLGVTMPAVADEIAALGDLVKGKASGCPVAIVRGMGRVVASLDAPGARSLTRVGSDDLFRLGTEEAFAEGYAAGRAAQAVPGVGLHRER
ncbi:coenzyme F420-0:L-glutamate ligase [Rathayibacter toxicus]|uniref:Coenzyme F420-0:L-glutamate ligase n=1 Tax=Rathayibacter toxicus TaxID=145458 RepID=A0A0C5BAD0_9MICO|nr:coenzyme F420-0:L-glutamate ligase [Rathayibacter toxicus]AJM77843.1 F420-dependent oxidoreductase [Rathayibacter toxicus]ALS57968.1 F420-dependent oxidoreductase [Rathayibacter toxicus]KKM44318.1 F420-dependent oxidoreductase [Rathayibacter toxicus]PPG20348.1 coenzyme F420-0:L-glutamate ligase [Rathayibacter toxicus]PPG45449.1 coenzyme F420-0:L-glutamate ligase [Rathayibacter toxicus]